MSLRDRLVGIPIPTGIVRAMRQLLHRAIRLTNVVGLAVLEVVSKKQKVITRSEAAYFGDGFATVHHVDFLNDAKFALAYMNAFEEIPDDVRQMALDVRWRAHICTWAAHQALMLEGDFVECGVWYGILSRTVCEYVDFDRLNRRFLLFDSWGKMPGSHPLYENEIFEVVKRRFSKYPNVSLQRGLVPEVLERVTIDKIAYLSIDMNGSIAEREALEILYDKVVPGGVIYFDDYGWDYPELRRTVNDFFHNKPESLLHFPSGNAIVVKL